MSFESGEILGRKQLKSIFGGYEDDSEGGCKAVDKSVCSSGCKELSGSTYVCSTCCIA